MDCMHDELSYVNDNKIEGTEIRKERSDNTIVADEEFFAQYQGRDVMKFSKYTIIQALDNENCLEKAE